MNILLEHIEPCLSFAADRVRGQDIDAAYPAIRACRDYLILHREPSYAELEPRQIVSAAVAGAAHPVEVSGSHAAACSGDFEQLVIATRLILDSAILDLDASLDASIALDGDVPCIRLSINGPGKFPEDGIALAGFLYLPWDDLLASWIFASRGGRIDRQPTQLDLRLKGVRVFPEVRRADAAVLAALIEAERFSRLLVAREAGIDATSAKKTIETALTAALSAIDSNDDPEQPGNLATLLSTSLAPSFTPQNTVRWNHSDPSPMPPIKMRRNRISRLANTVAAMVNGALDHGGQLTSMLDYNAAARAVEWWVEGAGKVSSTGVSRLLPSIQRAVDVHGGGLTWDVSENGFTVAISLPDHIALELDGWIPNWEAFSVRSVQMLRLFRSAGPGLPENVVLSGVLEDELERRLIPRLSVAPATNLAHEMKPRPGLAGSLPARVDKVLTQIQRGKPKKEICSPLYAAEIVWLFARDERHRQAIGATAASESDLRNLAEKLLQPELDISGTLQLVARLLDLPAA